jgi:steroid 5-alpha reductase family enzyme
MQDEDFRYVNFRNSAGRFYWVVSFLSIHMFPTMIVFLGCMAVYPALAYHSSPFGTVDVIAAVVTLSAIVIETIADRQLRHFIKNPSGTFLQSGLWKYSRHPNYFGEVLFWVGLFLFSLTPVAPHLRAVVQWWTFLGPVAMILLFFFISVPIMDKRMLQKKEGYRAYMKKTSALVPWFRRRIRI